MFGNRIDYQLLRLLTHRRGLATHADLQQRATRSVYTLADAEKYLSRVSGVLFRGSFDCDPGLSYLDIGCGMGRLSLGLVAAGATDVTGLDILGRNVTEAQHLARTLLPAAKRPDFIHTDIHSWQTTRRFDRVIVLGAMEHIRDQAEFLNALPRLLKPGGRCYVSIEPFHSPVGDHMRHFFRVPVPWMGLLFNEQAVLRRRREVFRPDDTATRYEDIEGGLNKVRYGVYRRNLRRSGLEITRHYANPQLAAHPALFPARAVSALLTRIPRLRDYFIVTDYAVLRHATTRPAIK